MKKIPIGISDFKRIIEDEYYYVDRSLFIKEIIDDGSTVLLIPRPRRFGKTLNMTMLKYFYEKSTEDTKYLFNSLRVAGHKDIMEHHGKYPVIYITFKDIKDSNYEKCYEKIKELISQEYSKNKYLLGCLEEEDRIYYNDIIFKRASEAEYETSLKNLSNFLYKYEGKRVVILIDEYDVPIQSGYLNDYYDNVIEFMRNFLSAALKDNEYIEKAVMTGILRIAKESIFSGLNNIEVYSILKESYSDSFGFLEADVEQILKYYNITAEIDEVKGWYNGYAFGDNVIYNPWSILNYAKNSEEGLRPYWVNTSSNDLVRNVLTKGGEGVKKELEALIEDKELEKFINEDVVMNDINRSTENLWSFLLFSGYLKASNKELRRGRSYCSLKIPNLEVKYLYEEIILSWFNDNISSEKLNIMLKALVNGDIKIFGKILKEFVLSSVSYFDTGGGESEKVYHALVLGMLVGLGEEYQVKSNGESGYGRYDVMIIPKDINKKGIIIEFKKVDEEDEEDLEKAVKAALKQIKEKDYKRELTDRGVTDIIEVGIAFQGKNVLVSN
jgi:hypothetical protein